MSEVHLNVPPASGQIMAVNKDSQGLVEIAAKVQGSRSLLSDQQSADRIAPVPHATEEEELFGVAARAKILTAAVSMHLTPQWRKRIFQQLDFLLSATNWDSLSTMPRIAAYENFLRTVINYRGLKPPYLGITRTGNIRAAWKEQAFELSCEFFPTDRVRFLLKQTVEGKAESLAWDGPVERLRAMLEQRAVI